MEQWILPFYAYLQDAISAPQDVELETLWEWFDLAIADLDDQAKLKVAGEAIFQIAAVFAAKTGMALEEVMASASQDGPEMRLDEFDCYVRQTMQIDLEQYIEPISSLDVPDCPITPWSAWQELQARQAVESSVINEISTSVLEEWIGLLQELTDVSEEAQIEKIKELSHGEDIEAWSARLINCLKKLRRRHKQRPISFLDVLQALRLPPAETSEIWLAFLLGDHPYQLQRIAHDFYSVVGIEVVIADSD